MARTVALTGNALPLVYSCSGCSSAAQLSNHLAVRLDRAGLAEMSCIAGVGGQVSSLVRKAREAARAGRAIMAIDGCALACVKNVLALQGIVPSEHILLAEVGVRKKFRADFDPAQADQIYAALAERMQARAGGAAADMADRPSAAEPVQVAGLAPAPAGDSRGEDRAGQALGDDC